ncbi:anti-sigma factor [Xanthobacter autotrophicus]|uniref:anti-sigma factor family protein n=1 Tax=Xanthobacter TaxID=279 RepID=UPI0024ABE0AD|nr:anti-sigma factor [Xanthobacter autotrophicus]MDI4663417.1 anti-sigma factor [Xanthobacter autotrophicus]
MTTRPIAEDDLNAYVDEALDAERRAEVVAYLETHPEMAERIAAHRAERDLLRVAFAPVVEEPLPPQLSLARMIEARRRPAGTPRWAMAAAAILLLGVGAAGGWSLRGMGVAPSGGLQALGREAAASYAVFAPDQARPVEIRAENRAQLVAWTSRRLGRPVAIPDLASSGYRLMGGRVVATEHGPAALFMYDDDKGNRLVMFARPMTNGRDMPVAPHVQDGINGYTWADDGLGYSLVGAVAPGLLHPLADEVRRQIRSEA